MVLTAAATGYLTAFSLILAIGAQNAFVLRQGLRDTHVFAVCLTCVLSDAILITAGVAGFGAVVALYPGLPKFMLWAGAIFLIGYGATRFYAAWKGGEGLEEGKATQSLRSTLITCLMLTWANPHVYLDTFGLIGAVSTGFAAGPAKTAFTLGAITASFSFFFGLGYGARLLAPLMRKPRTWVILDLAIGAFMWVLAVALIRAA